MTQYISMLLHDTVALITILNPIAAASIMISLIGDGATKDLTKKVAFKTTLTVLIASLITLFTGEYLFKFFGINVMSIKVIGGILLMQIAINMASGNSDKTRHTPTEHQEAQDKDDISIVPLGIPILFGPGVIATIIVLNHSNSSSASFITSYLLVALSIVIASFSTYFVLLKAINIKNLLGVTGMKILTRIMGLIVGAIAAQFIISGVKGLW